jgi:hypothetical protein
MQANFILLKVENHQAFSSKRVSLVFIIHIKMKEMRSNWGYINKYNEVNQDKSVIQLYWRDLPKTQWVKKAKNYGVGKSLPAKS